MESTDILVAPAPVKRTRKPKSIAVKAPAVLHKINMIEFKKAHFFIGNFKFNTSYIQRVVYYLKDGTEIETKFVEFKPVSAKCNIDGETYLDSETGPTFKLCYTSTKHKRSDFDYAVMYSFEDKPFYTHEFGRF